MKKCSCRLKKIQHSTSFKALSETKPLNLSHFYAAIGTIIEGNGPPPGNPVKNEIMFRLSVSMPKTVKMWPVSHAVPIRRCVFIVRVYRLVISIKQLTTWNVKFFFHKAQRVTVYVTKKKFCIRSKTIR